MINSGYKVFPYCYKVIAQKYILLINLQSPSIYSAKSSHIRYKVLAYSLQSRSSTFSNEMIF